jgi:hypothetical protein
MNAWIGEIIMMSMDKYAWEHVVQRIKHENQTTLSGRCWVRRREKCEKPQRCFSLYRLDDISHPTIAKFGLVGDFDELIKCVKFGVDRLLDAGCAWS